MNRSVVGIVAFLGLALSGPAALSAQLPGTPVYNVVVPSGISVAVDVGFPNDATGLGTSTALTGALGLGGVFGFTASVGTTKILDETKVAFGGTANWRVFGGPLIPLAVNLQAGAAYWEFDATGGKVKNIHVPIGVGLVLTIPTPGLAIKPWVAPRFDYSRLEPSGGGATDQSEFAWSAGIDLGFLNGLGVHAAYDWLRVEGMTMSTVGVGASYSFQTPGF